MIGTWILCLGNATVFFLVRTESGEAEDLNCNRGINLL